ncbi:hypothetical protein HBI71_000290 [Parastagonospora nodorum]|nr:hypothetical protein HBI71_000290 [Parastagonospora nodorum]KAH5424914.1 hypothetical protein HBI47_121610 [Parastagonospora nodorum]
MDYYNLFIALIFLATFLLIIVTGYIVNHHFRRDRKPQVDIENDPPEHQRSRPATVREHYDEEQRLSHLTTVAPSIELLPGIRTSKSSDRAEDWLERRDSRIMEGDPDPYKTPPGRDGNASKRKWRDQKDAAKTSEDEKGSKAKERKTLDDRVEDEDGRTGAKK